MTGLSQFLESSIGKKIVMAVTGVILSVFVLGHMTGNLLAFKGGGALDAYGATLRKLPAALWGVRLALLASVGLHIWAYLTTTFQSLAARPQGYRMTAYQESTLFSRTMRWTGPILGIFIVFHLLHLTTGTVHPHFVEGKVQENLVSGLSVVPVAAFYLVAMACLAFHAAHGTWSLLQTLGLSHPRYNGLRLWLAGVFTVVVVGGFASIPIGVLTGIIK